MHSENADYFKLKYRRMLVPDSLIGCYGLEDGDEKERIL
jgi:hypothetical protein